MSDVIHAHRWMFSVERYIAATLFGVILSAYVFAYLLHLFPTQPALWWLSVRTNQLVAPITHGIDLAGIEDPLVLIAVLTAVALAPLTRFVSRHWLATSICGHVALAVGIIAAAGKLQVESASKLSASLSPIVAISDMSPGTWSLFGTVAVLVSLCILNHVVFFRAARRGVGTASG